MKPVHTQGTVRWDEAAAAVDCLTAMISTKSKRSEAETPRRTESQRQD